MFKCYKHTNRKNGKGYIGWCSIPLDRRWYKHLYNSRNGSSYAFHRAIRKYGSDLFTEKLLATSKTVEEIKRIEIQMISEHQTHVSEWGYNMTKGGDGTIGYNLSEETKRKMSKANIGKHLSEETKEKISKSKIEKGSDISKKLIGNRNALGHEKSKESKNKIGGAQKGRNHSEEHKTKNSEAIKRYWVRKKLDN